MSETPTQREQTLREGVAEEIRALMGRRNVSRQAIAKALGVSHTTVWRRLSGDTALNLDELEAVARVLNVDIADLLPRRSEGRVLTTVGDPARHQGVHPNERSRHPARRPGPFGHPKRTRPDPSTRRPARVRTAHAA